MVIVVVVVVVVVAVVVAVWDTAGPIKSHVETLKRGPVHAPGGLSLFLCCVVQGPSLILLTQAPALRANTCHQSETCNLLHARDLD